MKSNYLKIIIPPIIDGRHGGIRENKHESR